MARLDNINTARDLGGIDWWEAQRGQFEGFELLPHIYRLFAKGQPVTVNQLAVVSSCSVQDVEAALRRHPGVDWDEQGRLVGFGLTLRPTPHRFTVDDQAVYTFCASDALTVPVILGRSGVLESTSPVTGQTIRVELTPERVEKVDPTSAVVSLVRPNTFDDVRTEICALGLFYTSSEEAADWLAAHPEGMVHSVEDDFALHREMMQRFGWAYSASTPH